MAAQTIRDKIVKKLVEVLSTISEYQPEADPYGAQFSTVVEGDVGELYKGKKAVAGVWDSTESKSDLNFPFRNCTLQVDVEVFGLKQAGTTALEVARRLIGVVERRVGEDVQLGGLAFDTRAVAADISESSQFEGYCSGVIRLEVLYRHHVQDPRKIV